MVQITKGNLLTAQTDALVNTVNTEGVMGKGIALQFKKAFPDMFKAYQEACKAKQVHIGSMQIFDRHSLVTPRFLINFPTKMEWRKPSRMEYVEKGLNDLIRIIREYQIHSIALPPLGCGNGGLNWADVREKIEKAFSQLPEVEVLLYEPAGAPEADKIVNNTERPKMTFSRAVVIKILQEYGVLGYQLSLLEVQKLLYFLQEFGEPLRLNFEKNVYGPYADNLRHVLNLFEGHFTRGYGEGKNKPETQMALLDGSVEEAEAYLNQNSNQDDAHKQRLEKVKQMIEGFESPYGLELLSTVHWLIKHDNMDLSNEQAIIQAVQNWNSRKKKIMQPRHILVALNRVKNFI